MRRVVSAVLLAVLSFVAAGELLCRLLPVSTATETDYRIDPLVRTYPPHHHWTTSTGWDLRRPQAMTANNEGFAAEHDFVRDPGAIALIGDSYVEASMLPMDQRLAHRLELALGGGRAVYAMGNPGTSLLDYAERIRLAHERYGVRDMVLLVEAGDVLQSMCGSGNVEGPCLDPASGTVRHETHAGASALKRLVRQSALAQYLFSQIKVDGVRLVRQVRQQVVPGQGGGAGSPAHASGVAMRGEAQIPAVDAVLDAFAARIQGQVAGSLVIIVDGDRGGARTFRMWDRSERGHFVARMRQIGAVVVDAEPIFQAHYRQSRLSLDVSPDDAHLNAVGLEVLASPVAEALASRP